MKARFGNVTCKTLSKNNDAMSIYAKSSASDIFGQARQPESKTLSKTVSASFSAQAPCPTEVLTRARNSNSAVNLDSSSCNVDLVLLQALALFTRG